MLYYSEYFILKFIIISVNIKNEYIYIIYVQIKLVVYIILVYIDDFNIKLNNVINNKYGIVKERIKQYIIKPVI